VKGKEESSFLKKRSKKLSLYWVVASAGQAAPGQEVFCFFFSKKQRLLSFITPDPSRS
jgi:hypothetical protein